MRAIKPEKFVQASMRSNANGAQKRHEAWKFVSNCCAGSLDRSCGVLDRVKLRDKQFLFIFCLRVQGLGFHLK